jgi:tetratricopeptide (TPR) repeat protein
LDEPANGTPEVLANAAERLHDVLAKRYSVLLLDNVTAPDEISWLLPQWTERNNRQPWLVIAGEMAIGAAVPGSRVPVAPLSADGMRKIWYADTDTVPKEPPRPLPDRRHRSFLARLRDVLRPRPDEAQPAPPSTRDPIDELVAVCGGRPRAIKAVARETSGSERDAEVAKLLSSLHSDERNPLVGIWRAIKVRTEDSLSPAAAWLLHALAELPVTALTRDAIRALVAARVPDADAGSADSLPAPFEELRVRGFVYRVRDRYRLPLEIRWAITGQTPEKNLEIARVAVPALVRHHADRVVRQANQLDVRSVGARAAAWLHEEEPSLRPLFSAEHYQDTAVLLAVIDDLARIASALEYWYVREQQADGLLKVSAAFGELADRADRSGLAALAAARRATAHRMVGHREQAMASLALAAGEARDPTANDLAAELVTRVRVEKALLGMAATRTADREKARRELEEIACRKRHPGAGIAMLNLGALHLAESSYDKALGYLEKAEAMARERHDVGCRAQAVELRGIALAATDLAEAVPMWQEARQLFQAIGEEQGEARCLQHLGAAALSDPAVAEVLTDAVELLEKAKQLRAGQPDTALVDEYLRAASDEQDPDQPAAAPTS